MRWLLEQWNDIKGNFKWTIVALILTGMTTATIALTHGLALWQQISLAVVFILMFGWAVLMTAGYAQTARLARAPASAMMPTDYWKLGMVILLNIMAASLKRELEDLREHFPNDPDLRSPLSASSIPDVIKEAKFKELWKFRHEYRLHLAQVQLYDREFPSEVAKSGFPLDAPSLDVLRMLETHIGTLGEREKSLTRL